MLKGQKHPGHRCYHLNRDSNPRYLATGYRLIVTGYFIVGNQREFTPATSFGQLIFNMLLVTPTHHHR